MQPKCAHQNGLPFTHQALTLDLENHPSPFEVSDVVEALTTIIICCRLATRTDPKLNKEGTDGALETVPFP
jgi:hypothetical protein